MRYVFLLHSPTRDAYSITEPDARRNDDLGLNMPLPVVQANVNCTQHCLFPPLSSPTVLQILFLNKNDLFERKVLTSEIKNFFPVR